ncbi:hypothetical protein ABT009_32815 [Streptomyces sp. NPDC002896]|uniref:hypothetical protein n=1 Tax=Streptomyces sp. NPDC002896 TaxID=3154438 RepID=UPI003322B7AA
MYRYLISFLPWIAYACVATSDEWRSGALLGLGIALVIIVYDRWSGKAWDEMVIECSAAVFFAGISCISFASPDSSLVRYGPALVNAWLALTAWGSLMIRRPFTMGVARRMVPEHVWTTPRFYRVNAVITLAWAVAFTVAAVALYALLKAAPHATTATIAIKIASFLIPAVFTARYSAASANRARQQQGA